MTIRILPGILAGACLRVFRHLLPLTLKDEDGAEQRLLWRAYLTAGKWTVMLVRDP